MIRGVFLTALCAAAPAMATPTHLTSARMIDPANGKVVSDPARVVDAGNITSVGTKATRSAPDGTETLDVGAKTILTGLIDMHTHLIGDASLGGYAGIGETREAAMIWGVINAEKTLMAGFTTARNVGAGDYADVALRDA